MKSLVSTDVAAKARIRNAALAAFATEGIEATSIRDVARAAGVSAGLVQHYFPTKSALRNAVNDHVATTVIGAFSDFTNERSSLDEIEELSHRVTAIVRDHPVALRYAVRAVIEGDEAAHELFAVFVQVARAQWQRVADAGLVHADADLLWAALQIVIYNLGTILFQPALDSHLPEPLFSPEGLERWRRASTELWWRGIYAPSP